MIIAAAWLLASCGGGASRGGAEMEKAFLSPPESAKPWVYWYWLNDNISKEGITRDLEAMAEVGIGEALIGNVKDPSASYGTVEALSEEWWGCVEHAIREAERVGIKIGLFNCPGWSQAGGPWIGWEESMHYLHTSETRVSGAGHVSVQLEQPGEQFNTVSVQAYPAPAHDNTLVNDRPVRIGHTQGIRNPGALFDRDPKTCADIVSYPASVEIYAGEPFNARSIELMPADLPMSAVLELQYQNAEGQWTTAATHRIDRATLYRTIGPEVFAPIAEAFPVVSSKAYRLVFTQGKLKLEKPTDVLGRIAEAKLGAGARISYAAEKQLAKLYPYPDVQPDSYEWGPSAEPEDPGFTVDPASVIDLTSRVDADGVLEWDAPEGEWIVQRTLALTTGAKNTPVTPVAEGYEVDKMNREYAQQHFDSYVGELLRRMPAEERKALSHIVADSYEQGSQNWTDGMTERFVEQYGYDPVPWLPVLRGRVVGSAELSERFLWDMRRLVADMIAQNFVGGMQEKCAQNGLKLWIENYGHWGFPAEFLNYGGAADRVAGEFWTGNRNASGTRFTHERECRIATSTAHIYGMGPISAESFTSSHTFVNMPRDLKYNGDFSWACGINHVVLHVYLHQPDERKPGMSAWFGTDFNRHSTWFGKMGSYVDYIRRSSALLQQGRHVADVAYYIGEETPIMAVELTPELPAGHSYDYINAEALLRYASVGKGEIVLSTGPRYRVLVLPEKVKMRPEIAEKITRLVRDGATVVGPRPESSPSMQGYPACDELVAATALEAWGGIDGESVTENRFGRGRIFHGISLEEAFARMEVTPDVELPAGLVFTHRLAQGSHAYFLASQSLDTIRGELSFRVEGMQPELWDAVSGEMRPLPEYRIENGRTYVPMYFAPSDSWFVVFRNPCQKGLEGMNFPEMRDAATLEGSWKVAFDPAMDAPRSADFESLADWTAHADPGIKYYSGTAVYTRTFDFKPEARRRYLLDLGRVETMATVVVNGHRTATLWRYPYRTEITGLLADGENTLAVEVTNTWWNRLVGDCQPGVEPKTWYAFGKVDRDKMQMSDNPADNVVFPVPWNKESELFPSGLTGPVKIVTYD